jgi:uncharacterized OsmC-like protein
MVSVAGCLGYDVLEFMEITSSNSFVVSVAGCLGYDVLAPQKNQRYRTIHFLPAHHNLNNQQLKHFMPAE